MRSLGGVLTLVPIALLLQGCTAAAPTSAGRYQGAERDVAKAIDDLADAARKGDAGRVCTKVVSPDFASRLRAGTSTCENEVKKAIGDADDYDLDVRDVTVTGTQATAQVRQGPRTATFRLAREGSDWRITSFG
jgi:hypothetical protein